MLKIYKEKRYLKKLLINGEYVFENIQQTRSAGSLIIFQSAMIVVEG